MDETKVVKPRDDRPKVWRRAATLVVLCVGLAIAATSANVQAILAASLEPARQMIVTSPVLGAALFILFAAVSAMLAFVSAAIVIPVALQAWGAPRTMMLLWSGWVLGGMMAYAAGRILGRSLVNWLSPGDALHRLELMVNRNTPLGAVVLLQLALPSEIPGYVLGLARYNFGKFLLAFALAEIPYAAGTVLLGASFLERRAGMVLALGLTFVAATVGLFYFLRKQQFERDLSPPT